MQSIISISKRLLFNINTNVIKKNYFNFFEKIFYEKTSCNRIKIIFDIYQINFFEKIFREINNVDFNFQQFNVSKKTICYYYSR